MNFLMIMFTASIVMSLIMLVLLGLSFLSRRLPNAQTRYVMWVILLVGLIIPFRPLIGDGLIKLEDPTYSLSGQVESQEGQGDLKEADPAKTVVGLEANKTEGAALSAGAKGGSPISLSTVLLAVWGLGALVSFGKYMIQYRRFHLLVKRWGKEVTDPYTLESFEFVKAKMGLEEKKIGLLLVNTVSTPMLTGIIKPVILLPEKPIEDDEMELILEHELTHYKHKDLWVNLIGVIALSLHWFNPILYFCLPAIYGDGESYCDETVLKNKNKDYRRFYGEVIISMIEASPQKHIALSTCFYAKKLNIKKRLYNIMEGSRKKKSLSVLSIALVLTLTFVSGSVIVFGAPGSTVSKEGREASKSLAEDKDIKKDKKDEAALENKEGISLGEAKNIAVRDAKLSPDEAHFVRVELSSDKKYYDVEFYGPKSEFDYEIDAKTGAILKQDRDVEGFNLADLLSNDGKKESSKDSGTEAGRDPSSADQNTGLQNTNHQDGGSYSNEGSGNTDSLKKDTKKDEGGDRPKIEGEKEAGDSKGDVETKVNTESKDKSEAEDIIDSKIVQPKDSNDKNSERDKAAEEQAKDNKPEENNAKEDKNSEAPDADDVNENEDAEDGEDED